MVVRRHSSSKSRVVMIITVTEAIICPGEFLLLTFLSLRGYITGLFNILGGMLS